MNKYYSNIYIGYLIGYYFNDPVILCVASDKSKVKYYLEDIRKLNKSQYDIRSIILDEESAYSLYEDYMLEDFTDKYLYLTNRDIEYINGEIITTIDNLESSYKAMIEYRDFISRIPSLKESLNNFNLTIKTMENQLSKVKIIKKIGKSIIKNSIVLSGNILSYLQHMGYLQESKELTELFYRKVHDDR